MTPREKALLHIYPQLAGLAELERRQVLERAAGAVSASDPGLTQEGFERAMAAYECILWERVDRKACADPRACRVCGRVMRSAPGGIGACPEGCETRKVYAWSRDYWRKKLPASGHANSRLIWKIRELWGLLLDYIPENDRTELYLAGIIYHSLSSSHRPPHGVGAFLNQSGRIAWEHLTAPQALMAIEALKDRLAYAVR